MISNPVASELFILPKSGDGSAVSLQLIGRCRETARAVSSMSFQCNRNYMNRIKNILVNLATYP